MSGDCMHPSFALRYNMKTFLLKRKGWQLRSASSDVGNILGSLELVVSTATGSPNIYRFFTESDVKVGDTILGSSNDEYTVTAVNEKYSYELEQVIVQQPQQQEAQA